MNQIGVFISLIIVFLLSSFPVSSQEKSKSITTYHFDDVSKPETITLSELGINNIEYIPLETNEKSLVSDMWKVKVYRDKIIIYDTRKISMFTMGGSYITEIGKQGAGPEEYQRCQDLDFFPKEKSIVVLSKLESKFYWYDYEGKFIKTTPAPKDACSFVCSDTSILCNCPNGTGNIENSYYIVNTDGDIIKEFANNYKYKPGKFPMRFMNENFFYKKGNDVYLKEFHSDTIFQWKKNDFVPAVIIDRGDKRLPVKAMVVNSAKELNLESYFIGQQNYGQLFDMNNFIFYKILYNDKKYDVILSQQNGKSVVKYADNGNVDWEEGETKFGIVDDLDGGPKSDFMMKIEDNKILSWITPFKLKDYVESNDFKKAKALFPEKKNALVNLANNLKEDDNLVLIVFTVKSEQ